MKPFAKFHSKIINIFIHNLNSKFFLIIHYTLKLFYNYVYKTKYIVFLYQIKCVSLPCVNKICRNLIFEACVVIYLTNPKIILVDNRGDLQVGLMTQLLSLVT